VCRLRPDHRADRSQRLDARRQRVAIAIDDAVELGQQCGGLFIA
jgi:hypothetical protein